MRNRTIIKLESGAALSMAEALHTALLDEMQCGARITVDLSATPQPDLSIFQLLAAARKDMGAGAEVVVRSSSSDLHAIARRFGLEVEDLPPAVAA